MKGIYVTDILEATEAVPTTGVGKKIQGQIKALKDSSIECTLHCLRTRENSFAQKILIRFAVFGDGLDWTVTDEMRGADFLYIRRPCFCSHGMIRFLREIRKVNPTCRLLLEIPTYPYDSEYKTSLFWIPLLWQERYWRRKLKKYIDKTVILCNDQEVFGIPAIHIKNGVDLSQLPVKKQNKSDCINLCCAAQFATWHGIDRLLLGLAEYESNRENKRKVHLYLAGEGPQSAELRKIAEMRHLQNVVTFCGRLNSDQLYEQLYDQCDIGVECLGNFRHGPDALSSSLKSREYLAAGLPILFAGRLDVIEDEQADFCLQIPSDESSVDVASLVSFYEKLLQNETKEQLSARIRLYAERHVGWDRTFKTVIQWLKEQTDQIP
ncbi:MAG TPA: glycosyltransferase [Candidatus Fournierella pullicola]|uniref:Glycosyltransferase n=1 Tax=Candidatus Allofournierella pullicola TaxID=2838596 RepID=A0A9D1V5G6_9FIRM|nr:glycosyltransferase [Candidatus Fournierella pullicola]